MYGGYNQNNFPPPPPVMFYPPPPKYKVTKALEYPHFTDLEYFYPLPAPEKLISKLLLASFLIPIIQLVLSLTFFVIVFLIAPTNSTSGFQAYLDTIQQLALILIIAPMVGIILSIGAIRLSGTIQTINRTPLAIVSLLLNILAPIIVFNLLEIFTALNK